MISQDVVSEHRRVEKDKQDISIRKSTKLEQFTVDAVNSRATAI
jgi:hypothetical protein